MWDEWFPDGVMVTVVQDVPEGWEDNIVFPIPRVLVVEYEDRVLLRIPGEMKVAYVEVAAIEDYEPPPGVRDKLVLDTKGQFWRFNSNIGPVLTAQLKAQREKQSFLWDPEKGEVAP